jgi:hypothetical protein
MPFLLGELAPRQVQFSKHARASSLYGTLNPPRSSGDPGLAWEDIGAWPPQSGSGPRVPPLAIGLAECCVLGLSTRQALPITRASESGGQASLSAGDPLEQVVQPRGHEIPAGLVRIGCRCCCTGWESVGFVAVMRNTEY